MISLSFLVIIIPLFRLSNRGESLADYIIDSINGLAEESGLANVRKEVYAHTRKNIDRYVCGTVSSLRRWGGADAYCCVILNPRLMMSFSVCCEVLRS